jgi:hypothetical protein
MSIGAKKKEIAIQQGSPTQAPSLAGDHFLWGWREIRPRLPRPQEGPTICGAAEEVSNREENPRPPN